MALLFVLVGVASSVLMFFVSAVAGVVSLAVVLLIAFFFFYFWAAVQKAYVELGNRDYMYAPAPLKPIYNPSEHKYHPSAPQQFNME